MSGLETAIRNALERADRSNPEIRARIYQSARQALETGLRKQDVTDPAVVAHQRHRLETTIRTVELEERRKLGVEVADPVADIQYGDFEADMAELDDRRDAEDEPAESEGFGDLRAERLGDAADPGVTAEAAAPVLAGAPSGRPGRASGRPSGRASTAPRPRKKRGFFARLFIWVMLLAFLAVGAWWALNSGLLLSDAERDTSVANPPAAVSEEDLPDASNGAVPAQDNTSNFSRDWIEIFKPGEIKRISAGSLAEARLVSTGDGPVIRITSRSGEPEGAVRILLPAEILRKAAGQEATIAITMRSATEKPVQVTVDCELAGMGTCERHRFTVAAQRSDALIQISPQDGEADQPALVLNSDATGEGGGVDLVAVRMLPVP